VKILPWKRTYRTKSLYPKEHRKVWAGGHAVLGRGRGSVLAINQNHLKKEIREKRKTT